MITFKQSFESNEEFQEFYNKIKDYENLKELVEAIQNKFREIEKYYTEENILEKVLDKREEEYTISEKEVEAALSMNDFLKEFFYNKKQELGIISLE